MSTYTIFWSIAVELDSEASVEDHIRHAAHTYRRLDLSDPGAANVFHVARRGSRAARWLEAGREHATRVDLGAKQEWVSSDAGVHCPRWTR